MRELTSSGEDQYVKYFSGEALIRTMHIKQLYDTIFLVCEKELGLTSLEIHIILFLANHSQYNTARDLCNIRMIPKSNASNGIRLLERKGFLRIEVDSENKKLHRLYLTEKCERIKEILLERQRGYLNIIMEEINADELQEMQRILSKLDNAIVRALEAYSQIPLDKL